MRFPLNFHTRKLGGSLLFRSKCFTDDPHKKSSENFPLKTKTKNYYLMWIYYSKLKQKAKSKKKKNLFSNLPTWQNMLKMSNKNTRPMCWMQLNLNISGKKFQKIFQKAYSEQSQTTYKKFFQKIVNGFQPSTVFAKSSVLDAWLGSWYVFVFGTLGLETHGGSL